MWRPLARHASFLGAASWFLTSAWSFADPAAATTKLTITSTATATERSRQVPAVAKSRLATGTATERHSSTIERSIQPPAALEEGTHFAVLSGVDGNSSKLAAVAAAMRKADVAFLGEYHDDPVAHALQLALLQHVAARLGHTAAPPPASGDVLSKQQDQQLKQKRPPIRPLILSLEMFETDVQPVLSEYLAGHIPLSDLMKDARPWSNYRHDYHHLVEVCKQLQLPCCAANAPRRYVSLAGRAGSAALLHLPAAAKQWLPPLPHAPPSEAYVRKMQHSMRQAAAGMDAFRKQQEADDTQQPDTQQQAQQQQQQQQQQDEGEPACSAVPAAAESKGCPYIGLTVSSNFLAAQSLWDATMAHTIAHALKQHQPQPQADMPAAAAAAAGAAVQAPNTPQRQPAADGGNGSGSSEGQLVPTGPLVVHVCGKFHCEDRLGIPEHLADYAPDAKVLVIVFVPAEKLEVTAEEAAAAGLVGAGDFVVLTDARLPRSFVAEHPV